MMRRIDEAEHVVFLAQVNDPFPGQDHAVRDINVR